jgi:hypothetical protein
MWAPGETVAAIILARQSLRVMHISVHFSCNLLRRPAERLTHTGARSVEVKERTMRAPALQRAAAIIHNMGYVFHIIKPTYGVKGGGEYNFRVTTSKG